VNSLVKKSSVGGGTIWRELNTTGCCKATQLPLGVQGNLTKKKVMISRVEMDFGNVLRGKRGDTNLGGTKKKKKQEENSAEEGCPGAVHQKNRKARPTRLESLPAGTKREKSNTKKGRSQASVPEERGGGREVFPVWMAV